MRSIVLLMVFLFAGSAMAKDLVIATVDMQKLFKEYPGTKRTEKKLMDMANEKRKDLADSAQEVKALEKDLKDTGSLLSAKTKQRKQAEYEEKAEKYNKLSEQAQLDLSNRQVELTQQLVQEIKDLAAAEAKQRGVDLVLDSEKAIYVRDGVDLTADLLKKFAKLDADTKKDPETKKK